MTEDERAKKWAGERKLNSELDRLTRVADESAARFGKSADRAEVCSSQCVTDKVMRWFTSDPGAELGADDELRAETDAFSKQYAFRRGRRRKRVQLFSETPNIEKLASREKGPEEIVQCAGLLSRLLKPVPHLLPAQQRLFVDAILQQNRLVDLAQDTGRSADALCKAIRRILDRLRKFLEGDEFNDGEIEDCMSMLDEFRNID